MPRFPHERSFGVPWGDPERRIFLKRQRGREGPWEVYRDGERLGVVWPEGADWRAMKHGASKEMGRSYASRDDAIEALTRERRKGRRHWSDF